VLGRAVMQGVLIGLVAVAIGTVHALVHPVRTELPPLPTPAIPPVAPVAPGPTAPVHPSDTTKPPTGAQTAPGASGTTAPTPPAQPAAPRNERMITLARFKELMSGSLPLQIIDAREPDEFAAGHIPGALSIPPSEFLGKVPDLVNQRLSRDLPMVVYCTGGNCDASKLVAMRLIDLGFGQTYVYEDGFTGWTKAGEAVEK
jgi:rhodanese-related sulfurtransferase